MTRSDDRKRRAAEGKPDNFLSGKVRGGTIAGRATRGTAPQAGLEDEPLPGEASSTNTHAAEASPGASADRTRARQRD